MTNGIAGLQAVATPIDTQSGDARLDEETGQVSFASLFAGAAQALVPQPVPLAEKPEGTSELDASSDAENVEDADDTVGDADKLDRSIAALDPALQERLARVMARMREETGHEVQVGETYRSQSRQNSLYAQGRSAPGEVVTWTQSSKHTTGRAVDLLVDGGSAGSDAYAALRRIATQEGLRTLGERDPGHLELPSSLPRSVATQIANAATVESPTANETTVEDTTAGAMVFSSASAKVAAFKSTIANAPTMPTPATTPTAATTASVIAAMPTMPVDAPSADAVIVARVAQIAPTARVVSAKVDRPADVARVAAVARPGVANSLTRAPATQQAAPAPAQGSAIADQTGAGNQQSGSNPEEHSRQNAGDRDGAGYGAAYGAGRRAGNEFTVPSIVASTSAGTSAAHRAAEIIATQEDAPARPLSQIVMAVDAGNGTTDRIQLDLRGSSLNATIDAGDQRAAHAMAAHKSELVHTLTRDGLNIESLDIRATVAAPVATESAHRSSDSSSNSRSERGAQWQQQQHRQRSENERRQHQRDERGGKK